MRRDAGRQSMDRLLCLSEGPGHAQLYWCVASRALRVAAGACGAAAVAVWPEASGVNHCITHTSRRCNFKSISGVQRKLTAAHRESLH